MAQARGTCRPTTARRLHAMPLNPHVCTWNVTSLAALPNSQDKLAHICAGRVKGFTLLQETNWTESQPATLTTATLTSTLPRVMFVLDKQAVREYASFHPSGGSSLSTLQSSLVTCRMRYTKNTGHSCVSSMSMCTRLKLKTLVHASLLILRCCPTNASFLEVTLASCPVPRFGRI